MYLKFMILLVFLVTLTTAGHLKGYGPEHGAGGYGSAGYGSAGYGAAGYRTGGHGKEEKDAALGGAQLANFFKSRRDSYRYGRPKVHSVIKARSQGGAQISLYGKENKDYAFRG